MPLSTLSRSFTVRSPPTSGIPIAVRNSKVFPILAFSSQVFTPASVWMLTESCPCSEQYHAATQRVPLPEISASEPSAFIRRIPKSASLADTTHSTPSAPTPLWRSQMWQLNPAISSGAWSMEIIRKSLPQALALTNGMEAIGKVECSKVAMKCCGYCAGNCGVAAPVRFTR